MVGIYSPMGSAAIWKFPVLGWARFLCVNRLLKKGTRRQERFHVPHWDVCYTSRFVCGLTLTIQDLFQMGLSHVTWGLMNVGPDRDRTWGGSERLRLGNGAGIIRSTPLESRSKNNLSGIDVSQTHYKESPSLSSHSVLFTCLGTCPETNARVTPQTSAGMANSRDTLKWRLYNGPSTGVCLWPSLWEATPWYLVNGRYQLKVNANCFLQRPGYIPPNCKMVSRRKQCLWTF